MEAKVAYDDSEECTTQSERFFIESEVSSPVLGRQNPRHVFICKHHLASEQRPENEERESHYTQYLNT